jgi:hypothetical protein
MFVLFSQFLLGRMRAAALAAAFGVATSGPLAAQSANSFDWGFGAAFGRGTYTLDDGTEVEVYRAQFRPPIRRSPEDGTEGGGPGIRLILPAAVGLTDAPDEPLITDPVSLEAPVERADAYSFMPGVELELKPGELFTVRTSVQGGWAREHGGAEQSATLASFGVRSRLKFFDAPARPALILGMLWSGINPSEGERVALMRLTTALEFDIAVPRWQVRGHSMRLLPHVLEDRFYRPPPALAYGDDAIEDDSDELASEQQIGVAAGRDVPFKIWFLKFDAVGIAYRFSDRGDGFRLYLNSVF